MASAEKEDIELLKEYKESLEKARKTVEEKQFIVRLSGPVRAQPGAPNEWKVEMFKRNGADVLPTKVEWAVKDETGQTLYSEQKQAIGKSGFLTPPVVTLPIAFWEKVKPDSELQMEVTAFDDNLKSHVSAKVSLARPVYVTQLATDKPLYKQGEIVYFRSLTLDRTSFTPPDKDMELEFRMIKPDGSVEKIDDRVARVFADDNRPDRQILGPDKKPLRGLGCGEYALDPKAPGGEYKLVVLDVTPARDERHGQRVKREKVLETRKFNVTEYKPEIFEKTLEFDGKSYGPGDVVMVKCTASRTQGGKLRKARVVASATVDDQPIQINPAITDDEGVVRLKFTLPANITNGAGSLTVTFFDGGEPEAIVRRIPIVGRKIDVAFFPEGGDLIENVPCRVYFQATTHTGKPADLNGFVTDGAEIVAEAATLTDADEAGVNRGQGVFTFTPKPGKKYFLKVRKPIGIIEPAILLPGAPRVAGVAGAANIGGAGSLLGVAPTGFPLPGAKTDGVVLTALDPVTGPNQPIRVQVQTGTSRKSLVVGAYARGRLLDHLRTEVELGKAQVVVLNPNALAGGVTRLTVFEEKAPGENKAANLAPVAERLVYRRPGQRLVLNVSPDKSRYNPGSKAGLDILALDENKKPVPAVLMVAVVNQSVLTMADEKTGRLMPTHFLLASEVNKPEDLEHADFLLYDPASDHTALTKDEREMMAQRGAKAAQTLDLLLGTQGWRRFAEQHPDDGRRGEVERLLVSNGQRSQVPVETFRQEEEKVDAEYRAKLEISQARLNEAAAAIIEIESGSDKFKAEVAHLESRINDSRRQYGESLAALRNYEKSNGETRSLLLAGFCIGLLLISGICVLVAVARKRRGSVPYYAAALGSFAVCAVVLVAVVLGDRRVEPTPGFARSGAGEEPQVTQLNARINEAPANDPLPAPAEGAMDFEKEDNKFGDEFLRRQVEKRLEIADPRKLAAAAPAPQAEPAPMQGFGGAGGAGRRGPQQPMGPGRPGAAPRGFAPAAKAMMKRGAGDAPNRLEEAEQTADFRGKDAAKQLQQRVGKGGEEFNRQRALADRRLQEMKKLRDPRNRANIGGVGGRGFGGGGFDGRGGAMGELPAGAMGAKRLDEALSLFELDDIPSFFVREYKFEKTGDSNVRDDFTETVYWHPVLVVPENGHAAVHFQLSDSICRYQVLVAGHTVDGRIGAMTTHIEARKPFTVDPKVPIEINSSDRIDVPVRVVNDSDIQRTVTYTVTPNGLSADDQVKSGDPKASYPVARPGATKADSSPKIVNGNVTGWIELPANLKGRNIISFRPTKLEGEVGLRVAANSEPFDAPDQIVRNFRVVPDGFPFSGAVSDLLEKKALASFELPKDYVKGTLKVHVNVYPTTLADLQSGLEGLLREPGGCFEQTSSSNYPNLLILDYLKTSDQSKPELARRSKEMLDRGYQILVGFECPKSDTNDRRGFEWFGQRDQQHQALTAYGLLQFKDLAKVHKVDPELIKRTQLYLLGQQNPNKNGFRRNQTAIDTFGRAPDYITDAYIVWALVESDPDDKEGMIDLVKQLDYLKQQAKEHPQGKQDPYFLALVANALLQRPTNGNREAAVAILEQIAGNNLKNGGVEGASTSITASGGRDLEIETTALAVLGWLRCGEPKFFKQVKESAKWIGQQRSGYGGFGSTQSTILALKALIEYTKIAKKPAEAGEYRLTVNGKTFSKTFTAKDQEVLTLEINNPEDVFVPGKNEVALEISTKAAYPFTLSWSYRTRTPVSSDKCALEIATKLDRDKAMEGETVKLDISLRNKVAKGHGMAVAIVGLPGGARLPADLKELTKLREDGKISYFEIRGRELVLYWRSLKPEEKIDLSVGLICDVPGEFHGPASRSYLYYDADSKNWVEPLAITIAPSK